MIGALNGYRCTLTHFLRLGTCRFFLWNLYTSFTYSLYAASFYTTRSTSTGFRGSNFFMELKLRLPDELAFCDVIYRTNFEFAYLTECNSKYLTEIIKSCFGNYM